MLNNLLKQPIFVVITLFGCLFILFGSFKIEDITKLAVSPLPQPSYFCISLGIILLLIGIVLYIMTNFSISTFMLANIKRLPNGYSISDHSLTLNVLLGRIETINCSGKNTMIALPANEFFDDGCIRDDRSALGAYMMHHFRNKIGDIELEIESLLRNEPSNAVKKEPGNESLSYGIGKCINLGHPLSSQPAITMVSVTTKRSNEGLRAEPRYIFDAVKSIQCEMANNRFTDLYVPVLGSGHGGLKEEISLACMLISFVNLYRKESGHHLRNINIVVFKRDEKSKSSISTKTIKQLLILTKRLLKN